MAPKSGKFGVVNNQAAVSNWSINDAHTPAEAITSATGLGTDRVKGIESWDGTFEQQLAEPSILPGSIFTFEGFTAPEDGTVTGDGVTYSGQALMQQAVINWDWAGGANLNSALTFLGHLALTIGTGNFQDASVSDPLSVCGTKIEHSSDGVAWTELENISTASLTLSCVASAYVNSSTGCWTGQDAGPRNWTAAIVLDETSRTAPVPSKGSSLWWRFYVDATTFYLCKWGMVRDFTGITVDRTTGAIIQQTMNVDMDVSDGTELGYVTTPSGVDWHGTSPP